MALIISEQARRALEDLGITIEGDDNTPEIRLRISPVDVVYITAAFNLENFQTIDLAVDATGGLISRIAEEETERLRKLARRHLRPTE